MKFLLLFLSSLTLFSSHSFAQNISAATEVPAPTDTKPQPAPTPVPVPAIVAPDKSAQFFGSINYSFLDIPIFAKFGATLSYFTDTHHLIEFEYMTGSIGTAVLFADIGSIIDTKISLKRRSYYGGTFNMHYGITYFNFSAKLGDDLMNNVSNNTYPSLDMVDVEAFGATFGIGNSWAFKNNVVVGIDWLSIAQPILVTKKEAPYLDYSTDPGDKDDVETALRIISYLPRISLIQVYLGYKF